MPDEILTNRPDGPPGSEPPSPSLSAEAIHRVSTSRVTCIAARPSMPRTGPPSASSVRAGAAHSKPSVSHEKAHGAVVALRSGRGEGWLWWGGPADAGQGAAPAVVAQAAA
jgi:hypothetical protein